MSTTKSTSDLDKYRLRRFVDRLIDMGEVEIHDEPVPLTGLSTIIERTDKAVLFKKAGPEQTEIVAKTAGNRKRLAAAFGVARGQALRRVFQAPRQPAAGGGGALRRRAGASGQDHRQGRRPHQAAVPSAARLRRQLLHELGDRLRDRSGDRPPQRRLPPAEPAQPLRDRHQRHRAVRPQAHLHRLRGARPEAADHLHGRHASARLRRRHHARAGRRAGAGRHAARRAGAGREEPDQRHPGAGRRRDDPRRLSRRARLRGAGRPVRRIHGLLRLDPHGPGVPLHRHHHAHATCCTTRCCTARPSCSTRPTAPTSAPCAPKPRRCRSCSTVVREPVAVYSALGVGRLQHAARLDQAARLRRGAAPRSPRCSAASCG